MAQRTSSAHPPVAGRTECRTASARVFALAPRHGPGFRRWACSPASGAQSLATNPIRFRFAAQWELRARLRCPTARNFFYLTPGQFADFFSFLDVTPPSCVRSHLTRAGARHHARAARRCQMSETWFQIPSPGPIHRRVAKFVRHLGTPPRPKPRESARRYTEPPPRLAPLPNVGEVVPNTPAGADRPARREILPTFGKLRRTQGRRI